MAGRQRPLFVCAVLVMALGAIAGPRSVEGQPTGKLPPIYDGAGLDEQLGETIPLDVVLRDENGMERTLGSLIPDDRPVLLNFVYYNCPMLCSILLDGMTNALRQMEWTPGQQFEVVTVSFAANEGSELAQQQKARYVGSLQRPEAEQGWHFMTGDSASIQQLTASVGFQFKWVESQQEYVHPATIIFVSPSGVITRYLHGLQFNPRDIRTALVEASEGKVGTPLDQAILFCFRYDPDSGSYVPYATNIMKLGGLLTLIVLGTALFVFWRRENRRLVDSKSAQMAAE